MRLLHCRWILLLLCHQGNPWSLGGHQIQWCRTPVLDQPGAKVALMSAEIPSTHLALTTDRALGSLSLPVPRSAPCPQVCTLSQEGRIRAPSTPALEPCSRASHGSQLPWEQSTPAALQTMASSPTPSAPPLPCHQPGLQQTPHCAEQTPHTHIPVRAPLPPVARIQCHPLRKDATQDARWSCRRQPGGWSERLGWGSLWTEPQEVGSWLAGFRA